MRRATHDYREHDFPGSPQGATGPLSFLFEKDRGVAPTDSHRHAFGARPSPSSTPLSVAPSADPRLALVFQQIRAINGASESAMARVLGTGVDVVLSFEAGAVNELPAWPETARIVERYAQLGNVDPAPILTRLLSLQTMPVVPPPRQVPSIDDAPVLQRTRVNSSTAAAAPQGTLRVQDQAPAPQAIMPPAPVTVSPAPLGFAAPSKLRTPGETTVRTRPEVPKADDGAMAASRQRRQRRIRRTLIATSPLMALTLTALLVLVVPGPVYAAARFMPGVLGSMTRGFIDVIVTQTATFKDGLRWIDPIDPRQRKSHRIGS